VSRGSSGRWALSGSATSPCSFSGTRALAGSRPGILPPACAPGGWPWQIRGPGDSVAHSRLHGGCPSGGQRGRLRPWPRIRLERRRKKARSRGAQSATWDARRPAERTTPGPLGLDVQRYGTTIVKSTLSDTVLFPPAVNVYVRTSNWPAAQPLGWLSQYADRLLPLELPHSMLTAGADPASVTPPEESGNRRPSTAASPR
jgi:hypothetical protein